MDSFENTLCVIPSRFGSTRFPGKPLALFHGIPIVLCVAKAASQALGSRNVIVATDDVRIYDVAKQSGYQVSMTPSECSSGTARIAWLLRNNPKLHPDKNIIINVQGDEPAIHPDHIQHLARISNMKTRWNPYSYLVDPGNRTKAFSTVMATLATPIRSWKDFQDPNCVKVVCNQYGHALYFSRSPIPHIKPTLMTEENEMKLLHCQQAETPRVFLRHIGMYSFHRSFLLHHYFESSNVNATSLSPLEQNESLEQLSWMYYSDTDLLLDQATDPQGAVLDSNNTTDKVERNPKFTRPRVTSAIYVGVIFDHPLHGVDTPEDLERLHKEMGTS